MILGTGTRIHFVGIGGVGMSAIARILMEQGCRVSGSDLVESVFTQRLQSRGARIFIGHSENNIPDDIELAVYSGAVQRDNEEMREIERRGVPLFRRSVMLSRLMAGKTGIAVSGTHGKTTTTSMLSLVLHQAGLDPTVVVGGEIEDLGGNARLGQGAHFIAEIDESDGSIIEYMPDYSIITNIDDDHMGEYYADINAIMDAFKGFIRNTSDSGKIFCCCDDFYLREVIRDHYGDKRFITYGFSHDADLYAEIQEMGSLGSRFSVVFRGKDRGEFLLNVPGVHNVCNSLAAIATGIELGIDFPVMREALSSYRGVKRRFEIKGHINDVTIIDDYAHHPTEIKATLSAVKVSSHDRNRIVGIFQPHRYTRTHVLRESFRDAFLGADELVLTDVYGAGEPPIDGIDGRVIYNSIIDSGYKNVTYISEKEDIHKHLLRIIQPRDTVVIMGAGDISMVADRLVEELSSAHTGRQPSVMMNGV